MVRTFNVQLVVDDAASFVDDKTGEKKRYTSYTIVVKGENIRVKLNPAYSKLLTFLLK